MSSNDNFKEYINNVLSTANQLFMEDVNTIQAGLLFPCKKGGVQALEQLQIQHIRKISGLQHLTFWQQLKYVSLIYLERRRESYSIMYVWRILKRHAPNCLTCQGVMA